MAKHSIHRWSISPEKTMITLQPTQVVGCGLVWQSLVTP
jgi:hypothetical protein